jgi:hypothetical protein
MAGRTGARFSALIGRKVLRCVDHINPAGGSRVSDTAGLPTHGRHDMTTETPDQTPPPAPPKLTREQVDQLAALLAPLLRDAAGNLPGDLSDLDVLVDARPIEVLDALHAAGVLVYDDAADRAHLRKSWAAMSTALFALAERRPLDPAVLAVIPGAHQVYLLGHQARGAQLDDAWRRMLAAREDLAAILRRGTVPSPVTLGAILAELGGDDPYAGGRPDDADPWWGCWVDPAAIPEAYEWERYERTIDPDAQLDGLGDLCLWLGGTWGDPHHGGVGGTDRSEGGSITALILRLIVKAQNTPERFAQLERAFPREVLAWRTWMLMADHSPTARELYLELAGGDPRPATPGPAGDPDDTRPAPVYAGVDEAALAAQIDARAVTYADAIAAGPDHTYAIRRDRLRPVTVGGPDLWATIPDGARAYALPWPAGTRALYHPVDGVGVRETGRDRTGMADTEILWRDLFVEAPGGGHVVPLGRVRRLEPHEMRRGHRRSWWRCRHCGLGATGAANVKAEKAECEGHEAICPDQDQLRDTGVPRDGGRPRSAISPGDPDWVEGFGPVPGASLGNLGEDL